MLLSRFMRAGGMSCHQVGKVLQSYLDSELNESTAQKVMAHLELCRRCGMQAEMYEEIKRALAARTTPVPDDAVERLREFSDKLMQGEIDSTVIDDEQ